MDPVLQEELPPQFNFRDIGGLRTKEGRLIRKGKVFRSAAPEKIGRETFIGIVHAHHIENIVDLRASVELEELDIAVGSFGERRHSIPLFESIQPSWVNPKDVRPIAIATRYLEMLEGGIHPIHQIIELVLSEHSGGTLVHCAAGRDRTGIVISVLLSLVNVDLLEISNDYGKSNMAVSDGYLALPETIYKLFELIESKYGSISYFASLNGITEDKVEMLRKILVEDRREERRTTTST